MTDLDLRAFRALTFDCYGTLIDWESGLAAALDRILQRHGHEVERDSILELHSRLEPAAQEGPYRPYREVLGRVVDGFGDRYGFSPDPCERGELAESVADWPTFPDTVEALQRLASRYSLGILSNIDDDLFAGSARLLRVDFQWVITAQQVGSYKPARGHFDRALEILGIPQRGILHVAQSLFHDIAVARELGFSTVWVNRRHGAQGGGATPPSGAKPHLEVPDLATLADLAGC